MKGSVKLHPGILHVFALILLAVLLRALWAQSGATGAAFLICPQGYVSLGGHCVEKACRDTGVKCIIEGNLVKRPDCHCLKQMGRLMCILKGNEKTAAKLPTCIRNGQINSICGAYDTGIRQCVER
jgi:hypothetical protein